MLSVLAMSSGAATLLWILAVILVIAVALFRGSALAGVALIVIGLLMDPAA